MQQQRPQQPRVVPLHHLHRRQPHLRPPHPFPVHPRVNQEQEREEEVDQPLIMLVANSSQVNPLERIILHFKIWTSNEDLEEKESLKNRRFI